ncbi:MAG: DNA repair protein RecO [Desulfuromonadaceae bacterium GWC2_58_13]|nr:MAG: DNA repair protein RecO [Desulfuromonadaceae bacterium GWC2_58_13]
MREFRSEAIVLRHLDYGEADRIVTFFAPGHGRLRGFARAARKSRRRFAASLEPFASVILHWSPARSGGLVTLKEAELIDLRVGLRADLPAIALAGYACELIEALFAEEEAQDQVYELLRTLLDHLSSRGGTPLARLLFELRLLNLSGYIPHLLHCASCFGGLPGPEVRFAAEKGGSLCPACVGKGRSVAVSLLTVGSISRILRGPLSIFAEIRLSPRTLAEGERLVADTLRCHLSRPLRSTGFLDQVLPFSASGEVV